MQLLASFNADNYWCHNKIVSEYAELIRRKIIFITSIGA
jgi:hypothetical protein